MTVVFILAGCGAVIAVINFYLSFIRYPLHRLWFRDSPFQWVSGFPLVGSLMLWIAALSFWLLGNAQIAAIALIVSVFDTGGIHWFIASQLRTKGHDHEADLKAQATDSDRRANEKERD